MARGSCMGGPAWEGGARLPARGAVGVQTHARIRASDQSPQQSPNRVPALSPLPLTALTRPASKGTRWASPDYHHAVSSARQGVHACKPWCSRFFSLPAQPRSDHPALNSAVLDRATAEAAGSVCGGRAGGRRRGEPPVRGSSRCTRSSSSIATAVYSDSHGYRGGDGCHQVGGWDSGTPLAGGCCSCCPTEARLAILAASRSLARPCRRRLPDEDLSVREVRIRWG